MDSLNVALFVAAAFFGGLTLGSWTLGSRISDSARPVRWYMGCELVIAGWNRAAGAVLKLAIHTTGTSVLAEVREPLPRTPPAAHAIEETRRLVEMNGGTLDISDDAVSKERVITIKFPAGE